MKRTVITLLFAIVAALSATVYADTRISPSELPHSARTFLNKYFRSDHIRKAEKDHGKRGPEYEVKLMSGTEVEFNADGTWKEVKAARGRSVPRSFVPAAILKYISANCYCKTIVEISRERGGYEVELADGTELHLTQDGKQMQHGQGGGGKYHKH